MQLPMQEHVDCLIHGRTDPLAGLAAVATQSSCKGGSLGDREGKGQRRKAREAAIEDVA